MCENGREREKVSLTFINKQQQEIAMEAFAFTCEKTRRSYLLLRDFNNF